MTTATQLPFTARAAARLDRHAVRLAQIAAVTVITALTAFVTWRASVTIDGTRYFWLDDDQMVSLRYARHLADGLGPVWNIGERVEGYSNPLWVVIMAAVHRLPLADAHTALAVKGIAWLLALAVPVLADRLLAALDGGRPWARATLWVTLAGCADLIYWSANGFETTLLTVVFLLVAGRLLREAAGGQSRLLTYVWLGTLPVIRSDAQPLWLALALLALGLSRDRRRTLLLLGVAALLPLAHVLWRVSYYGAWLPNTYTLKVAAVPDVLRNGASYLSIFVRHYGVALGVAALGAWRLRDRRVLLAGVAVVFGMGFILIVGDDIFPYSRYLAYMVPLLLALALASVARLAPDATARGLLYAALAVGVLLPAGAYRPNQLISTNGLPARAVVPGVLLARHTAPDAVIATWAAGTAPYFSDRPAIDLLGKTDPVIARLPARPGESVGHNKYDMIAALERRPDVVLTFFSAERTTEWLFEADTPLLDSFTAHYSVQLVRNDIFRRDYYPQPVPLPYLLANHALYVRGDSAEAARLADWREPVVQP